MIVAVDESHEYFCTESNFKQFHDKTCGKNVVQIRTFYTWFHQFVFTTRYSFLLADNRFPSKIFLFLTDLP